MFTTFYNHGSISQSCSEVNGDFVLKTHTIFRTPCV